MRSRLPSLVWMLLEWFFADFLSMNIFGQSLQLKQPFTRWISFLWCCKYCRQLNASAQSLKPTLLDSWIYTLLFVKYLVNLPYLNKLFIPSFILVFVFIWTFMELGRLHKYYLNVFFFLFHNQNVTSIHFISVFACFVKLLFGFRFEVFFTILSINFYIIALLHSGCTPP